MSRLEPAPRSPLWREGWYQFSARLSTPNFGARPPASVVDLIVLHCISLPPGQYTGNAVQRFFANELDGNAHPYFRSIGDLRVSSHFFIRRNGELQQFVSCDERAWHAGVSRYRGRANCNDHSIGIELEGVAGDCFEDSQYDTLGSLCAAIMQRYPITDIAGHQHIAPGRKTDPGTGFDWSRLQRMMGLQRNFLPDDAMLLHNT